MRNITIYRPKEVFNYFASYSVFIDDEMAFSLKNGEKKEFSASPDAKIYAKVDWCSSNTISIKENSKLVIGVNKNLLLWLVICIIATMIIYMTRSEYTLGPVFLMALVLIYYLSLGKKKYLRITEI